MTTQTAVLLLFKKKTPAATALYLLCPNVRVDTLLIFLLSNTKDSGLQKRSIYWTPKEKEWKEKPLFVTYSLQHSEIRG